MTSSRSHRIPALPPAMRRRAAASPARCRRPEPASPQLSPAAASPQLSFGLSILEFYLGRFLLGENLGKLGDWAALMVAICYSDSPAAALPPAASPELRSFIGCCLQKNPARRPSAAQLLQDKFIAGPQPQALAAPPS